MKNVWSTMNAPASFKFERIRPATFYQQALFDDNPEELCELLKSVSHLKIAEYVCELLTGALRLKKEKCAVALCNRFPGKFTKLQRWKTPDYHLTRSGFSEESIVAIVDRLLSDGFKIDDCFIAEQIWENHMQVLLTCDKHGQFMSLEQCNDSFLKRAIELPDGREFLKILKSKKVDFNRPLDELGRTALHLSCTRPLQYEVGVELFSGGANVNSLDRNGRTAISYATPFLRIENLKRYIRLCAAHGACFNQCWPLAEVFCSITHSNSECVEIVELLCSFGADVNSDGKTLASYERQATSILTSLLLQFPFAYAQARIRTCLMMGATETMDELAKRSLPLPTVQLLWNAGLVDLHTAWTISENWHRDPAAHIAQLFPAESADWHSDQPELPVQLSSFETFSKYMDNERSRENRRDFVRERSDYLWKTRVRTLCLDAALGLAGKDLPALVMVTIVDFVGGWYADCVTMNRKWDCVARVKNAWRRKNG